MFPLTHALVAQKIIKNASSQAVLGSVFPDLANGIGLHRDITHEMGDEFYHFCREDGAENLEFAQAVISHGANPTCLDYYADQSYEGKEQGYCFQRGALLVDQVVAACAIPPGMGLWKAHNFIEMAFDVISVESYPNLTDQFQAALDDKRTVHDCSYLLGRFFQVDGAKIAESFLGMPRFFCLSNVTPIHLAEKYAIQLKKRHGVLKADPAAMADVIENARKIIEGEYISFINDAIDKIDHIMTQYPKE